MTETEPRYHVNDEHWRAQGVSMRRCLRLMSIIETLQQSRRTTEELAQKHNVSPRTIRDDISLIRGEPRYECVQSVQAWEIRDLTKDDP